MEEFFKNVKMTYNVLSKNKIQNILGVGACTYITQLIRQEIITGYSLYYGVHIALKSLNVEDIICMIILVIIVYLITRFLLF